MAKRKIEPSKVKVGKGKLNEQALQVVSGIIKAYFPRIGLYNVSLKGQIAHCYSLNYSGGMGMGLYAKGTYSPGESVFCIYNESQGEGYIIGALPQMFAGNNIAYPVSGESTIGLNQDKSMRNGLVTGPLSGCTTNDTKGIEVITDSHCGVHDLMPGGSFNMSSETGIRFFADSYSIGLQCDDATGVWVYSDDSYMRQSSINLQHIAGGKIEEDYNDNGELVETTGHSMFSWELLGKTEKPVDDTIKFDPGAVNGKPLGSPYVLDPDAKPFHRVVEYGGYLGHGYQRVVNAPPVSAPKSYSYGTSYPDQYCLSRIAQFADGEVSIESAKSIVLSKRCFIPSVQTMELADEFDGGVGDSSKDSKGEYDFSHEDVKLKSSPEFNTGLDSCEILQELSALIDYQSHLFNYKLVHPFVYHKKDYFVLDSEDTGLPTPQYRQWFEELKTQQFAKTPEEFSLDIHKKLESTYYASESGLALLPVGGVSLYGGYGEELRMGGGTATLSAPGDIWIKAGRNIHLWAGNDIIMKAKNCIDETTTEGSVRIKAEKHLELLGGNNGSDGGVIIESKSSGDFDFSESGENAKVGGLILRATEGTAVLEGKDTYIRSSIKESTGSITIDSGQPNGDINLCCGSEKHYLSGSFSIAGGTFDSSDSGTITSVFYLSPGSSPTDAGNLNMSLNVLNTGTVINKESIICGGSVIVRNMCATLLESPSMVLPVGSSNIEKYEQLFERVDTNLEAMTKLAQTSYDTLSAMLYTDKKAGNDDCLQDAGFSYRTEEEYGTVNDFGLSTFTLHADRWQNLMYVSDTGSGGGETWKETEVTNPRNVGKYPFPGDLFYESNSETCLVFQPLSLYNKYSGSYEMRMNAEGAVDEKYSDPKYEEPELKSLNEYIIIGGANG